MSKRVMGTLTILIALTGCSHQGNDDRIHPADSVRTRQDTAMTHVRDTVPDTSARRDTTSSH